MHISRNHAYEKPDTEGTGRSAAPNLLQINTQQNPHLVWHVLVISFSPLSVFVLGTVERCCLKRRFPVHPSLHLSSLSNPPEEKEKREVWRIVSLLNLKTHHFPFQIYSHTKTAFFKTLKKAFCKRSEEWFSVKMTMLSCTVDRGNKASPLSPEALCRFQFFLWLITLRAM